MSFLREFVSREMDASLLLFNALCGESVEEIFGGNVEELFGGAFGDTSERTPLRCRRSSGVSHQHLYVCMYACMYVCVYVCVPLCVGGARLV